jgi:hypothetical protein
MIHGILSLSLKVENLSNVYKTKYGPDASVDKCKVRLVAKEFSQVERINYTKTFALVAKMNSIPLILATVASHKWEVH